jgi:hypothetical protein
VTGAAWVVGGGLTLLGLWALVAWAKEGAALRLALKIKIAVDCRDCGKIMCLDISYSW